MVVHRVNRIFMDVMVVVDRINDVMWLYTGSIVLMDVMVVVHRVNRINGCDGGCTQDQSYYGCDGGCTQGQSY